jgi:hypothetical protein
MTPRGQDMTTAKPRSDDIRAAVAAVDAVDLTMINRKLRHDDPDFWTDAVVAEAERRYRLFLALHLVHSGRTFSLDKILDDYWHAHILDTRKYTVDCELLFGSYLHHDPYFGLEDDAEWEENLALFADTLDIWESTFGPDVRTTSSLTVDHDINHRTAEPELTSKRVYMYPQNCKSGQHCQKIVVPESEPEEPFDPSGPGVEPETPDER